MKFYSPAARAFIRFVCLLGLTALLATLWGPVLPGDNLTPLPTLLAMAAAGIAGTRKIYLLRTTELGQSRYVTLGFLVTFATLLALGVRAGVLAGIASALCADLYTASTGTHKRRMVLHEILFNAASIAVTAWCTGTIFAFLNGRVGHVQSHSLWAVMAAMLCYFLLNTISLATVVALCSHKRFDRIWREDFAWAFPMHLMSAAYVALAIIFIRDAALIALGATILPLAYQYCKMYGDHVAQKQELIDELQAGREVLNGLYLSTVKSLATAIAAKDQYTHDHIHRVQQYAVAVAERMGVSGDEMEAIRTGAVLHDIGKLGVPDYVLLKPGRLTEDEYAKMKRHPDVGADILEPVNFPWPVVSVVRHHHERWDGNGYPNGLAGEAIPLGARILTVADVYDALTTDRPYRAAWSDEKTIAFLLAESGAQFDPRVVDAFVSVVGEIATRLPRMENEARNAQDSENSQIFNTTSETTRQIRRTTSELWVLYKVGSMLGSAAPMPERLRLLGTELTSIMPGTTCAFMLYDSPEEVHCFPDAVPATTSGGRAVGASTQEHQPGRGASDGMNAPHAPPTDAPGLRLIAAAGLRVDLLYQRPFAPANAPSTRAARDGKTYRGAYSDADLAPSLAHLPAGSFQSVLIVPLQSGEGDKRDAMGVMTFYHHLPDAFTQDDENLLTMIADQVQTALCQNREHDQTRSDANTDALTGLHNMRYLRHKSASLLNTLQTPGSAGFALLYLDLDNFKNVNTLYGHPIGSRVLSDVAGLLPRELRPSDVAVRYGGDEFVVILPQASYDAARDVADRIRTAIRNYRPAFLPDFAPSCRLDVSSGIACCPAEGMNMEELVAIADQRMYENKMAQKGLCQPAENRHAGVPMPTPEALPPASALPSKPSGPGIYLDTAVVAGVMHRRAVPISEPAGVPEERLLTVE